MNELSDLRFAKVNVDYDRARAFAEIESLVPIMEQAVGAPYFENRVQPFRVASEDEEAALYAFKRATWKVLGLRHIPEVPESKIGGSSVRNRNLGKAWEWRYDIAIPYVREIVESLPLEDVYSVRVLTLSPGFIGGVHHDDPHDMFYPHSRDTVNLTLNVATGGSNLQFWQDEQIFEISDYPAFIFRDDCYHGVPKVQELRIQVRIHGKPSASFMALVDDKVRLDA